MSISSQSLIDQSNTKCEEHKMANTKFYNLTDVSRVTKHDKTNTFPSLLKKAQESQDKYELRLRGDDTKTDTEKTRLGYQHAIKNISGLLKDLDLQTKPRHVKNTKYRKSVTSWLEQDGTTNQLILNSTYQVMRDWPVPKLVQASKDDKNISKMILTTPAGKYGYEMSDQQRQMFFDDAVKHTLGDNLDDYESNQKVLEALTIAGENLIDSHNEIHDDLKVIESRVVNE